MPNNNKSTFFCNFFFATYNFALSSLFSLNQKKKKKGTNYLRVIKYLTIVSYRINLNDLSLKHFCFYYYLGIFERSERDYFTWKWTN